MNKYIIRITGVLFVIFTIIGCNVGKIKEIKLGAVLPLTGDIASYGNNTKNGIDMAVSEINKAGGVAGRKIFIVYEDDKGISKESVNAIQKLILTDKVPVVMGAAASSNTMAIAPIANKNKTVLITPISSSKELTDKGGEYFYRMCPSDAYQSRILADWIWTKGLKTVGIIYVNNSWGNGLKDEFITSYKKIGGKVLVEEASVEGDKDFRAQILKITQENPDAIFAPTYGIEGGIILTQLKELGIKHPVFGADVWSSPELLASAGDAAEGVMLTLPAEPSGRIYNEFAKEYKKNFNKDPDIYAAYSYDMMHIVYNALKAGCSTGEDIKTFLLGMQGYDGVTGKTVFDKHGDVISKDFSRQIIKNGKYTRY